MILNFQTYGTDLCIVLVIYRMRKYRRDFSSILNSSGSNLTSNRFLRLFLMSIAMIIILLPAASYVLYVQATHISLSYNWDLVHGEHWGDIMLIPTFGLVTFDRWIQIALGYTIFGFFGMGHDAQEMYRKALLHIGLGKIFPFLRQSRQQRRNMSSSVGSTTSSMGSRARLFVKRVSRYSIPAL